MRIKTSKFGEVDFDEKSIINFPNGIYGFENERKFIILNFGHKDFFWLQSLTNPEVSLLITEPFWFFPGYDEILKNKLFSFKINPNRYMVFTSVYISRKEKRIFSNIAAPFLIDKNRSVGIQLIIDELKEITNIDVIENLKKTYIKKSC